MIKIENAPASLEEEKEGTLNNIQNSQVIQVDQTF